MRTRRSFLGGLPLWPGFLLLINIELAFPKHGYCSEYIHVGHGATCVSGHELGWAGLSAG